MNEKAVREEMENIFMVDEPTFGGILEYPKIEIKRQGVTFIKGASGAGKSTLLKLLNGSISPDEGRILYDGKDILKMDTIDLRREVILIGQNVYLFDLTVRENFHEYYSYRDLPYPDDETIIKFLRLCHADFKLDESCVRMSGGERQRIYIAICISLMPRVILMDEPTSALDGNTSKILMENLSVFCRDNDMAMIVVSHDPILADEYADHVITIERGN